MPIIHITRDHDTTPEHLLRAHRVPEQLARWIDPDGVGDGSARLHAPSLVDCFEGRDQWLASGMEAGVEQRYAKLDALVAEIR